MTKEKEVPLVGVPEGEFEEQQLKANQVEEAEKQLEIRQALDNFAYPLTITGINQQGKWSYRNKAYRELAVSQDVESTEAMVKFINENK